MLDSTSGVPEVFAPIMYFQTASALFISLRQAAESVGLQSAEDRRPEKMGTLWAESTYDAENAFMKVYLSDPSVSYVGFALFMKHVNKPKLGLKLQYEAGNSVLVRDVSHGCFPDTTPEIFRAALDAAMAPHQDETEDQAIKTLFSIARSSFMNLHSL